MSQLSVFPRVLVCAPCSSASAKTGRCQRCQGSAYLLDGRCMPQAGACTAAGLVAVGGPGDSAYGRACVAAGGVCRFDAPHSCRSPKALGDCAASRITSRNATCLACHNASWLVNGESAREACASLCAAVASSDTAWLLLLGGCA